MEFSLKSTGHEVRAVSGGREAIDRGARWRPHLLIADWMLRDAMHGLHVTLALRAVNPDLQAILVTGFPSSDLRAAAARTGLAELIEKPFGVERLHGAVAQALSGRPASSMLPPVAVLEIDDAGRILHANPWALDLLGETLSGTTATRLPELFAEELPPLGAAFDHWLALRVRAASAVVWHLRVQAARVDGTRLAILRRQEDPQHMTNPVIDMLLGGRESGEGSWPLPGRVLVVSANPLSRRLAISMLENAGAGGYAVATAEEALRLARNDEGVAYVVLDEDEPPANLTGLAAAFSAVRAGMVLVAASAEQHVDTYRAAGIGHFLSKPWRLPALIGVLSEATAAASQGAR